MGEQEGGETGQEVEEPKQEVEPMEVEPAPEVAASEVPGSKVVEETAPDTPSAVDSLHTLLQGQEQMLAQTLLEGLTQRANSQTESQLFASFLVINFVSCNMFVQLFVGQFVLPSFQGWALLQAKLPLTRLPKIWQRSPSATEAPPASVAKAPSATEAPPASVAPAPSAPEPSSVAEPTFWPTLPDLDGIPLEEDTETAPTEPGEPAQLSKQELKGMGEGNLSSFICFSLIAYVFLCLDSLW